MSPYLRSGETVVFPLRRKMSSFTLEADPLMKIETVTLPVAQIGEIGQTWLALKSEETSIETLRMIPGFEEKKD